MTYLKSLPPQGVVFDVFSAQPVLFAPFVEFCNQAFRGPGPLAYQDREMIFAYVSELNHCHFCHGGHAATTVLLGAPGDLFDKLKVDIDSAPIDAKMKALLRYAKKLTETPSRMSQADADAVFAAGVSDDELIQAVSLCCLANFMNRLVEGTGIQADPAKFPMRAKMAVEKGYLKPFQEKMAAKASAAAS